MSVQWTPLAELVPDEPVTNDIYLAVGLPVGHLTISEAASKHMYVRFQPGRFIGLDQQEYAMWVAAAVPTAEEQLRHIGTAADSKKSASDTLRRLIEIGLLVKSPTLTEITQGDVELGEYAGLMACVPHVFGLGRGEQDGNSCAIRVGQTEQDLQPMAYHIWVHIDGVHCIGDVLDALAANIGQEAAEVAPAVLYFLFEQIKNGMGYLDNHS
jgi:hypothetical protein